MSDPLDVDLTCYYYDDNNELQGPFPATTMLGWIKEDFFKGSHRMCFTDNGLMKGDQITYEATVGEMHKVFGDETPIPMTVRDFERRSGGRVLEVESWQQSRQKKVKQCEAGSSLDQEETPRKTCYAGPDLPPDWCTEDRKLVRSSDKKGNKSSPKRSSSSGNEEKPSKRSHRPFYDVVHDVRNKTELPKIVAIEFAAIMMEEYGRLEKSEKTAVLADLGKMGLPEVCKVCKKGAGQPSNFFQHVLSVPHITKSMDNNNIKFTYEDDYLRMKQLIVKAKTTNYRGDGKENRPEIRKIDRDCLTS